MVTITTTTSIGSDGSGTWALPGTLPLSLYVSVFERVYVCVYVCTYVSVCERVCAYLSVTTASVGPVTKAAAL